MTKIKKGKYSVKLSNNFITILDKKKKFLKLNINNAYWLKEMLTITINYLYKSGRLIIRDDFGNIIYDVKKK